MDNKAVEDLAFIKQIITDSQKIFADNGRYYVLWSGLAILGILLKFLNETYRFNLQNLWIWLVILLTGLGVSLLMKRNSYRKSRSKSFAQKIFDSVWLAIFISVVVLVIAGYYTHTIYHFSVPSIIATMFGIGYMVSGTLTDSKWMTGASYLWWLAAIIMFLTPENISILLLAVLLIFLQFIPGIIIFRKWKRAYSAENK